MSLEVEKSQQKMANLHSELGKERFAAWQQEHGGEVLSPEQQLAVARETEQAHKATAT